MNKEDKKTSRLSDFYDSIIDFKRSDKFEKFLVELEDGIKSLVSVSYLLIAFAVFASCFGDALSMIGGDYPYERLLAVCMSGSMIMMISSLSSLANLICFSAMNGSVGISSVKKYLSAHVVVYFIFNVFIYDQNLEQGVALISAEKMVFLNDNIHIILLNVVFLRVLMFVIPMLSDISGRVDMRSSLEGVGKVARMGAVVPSGKRSDVVRVHESAHYLFYKIFDNDEQFDHDDELIVTRKSYDDSDGGYMRPKKAGFESDYVSVCLMYAAGYIAEEEFYPGSGFLSDKNFLTDIDKIEMTYYKHLSDPNSPELSLTEFRDSIDKEARRIVIENKSLIKEMCVHLSAKGDVLCSRDIIDSGIKDKILEVRGKEFKGRQERRD